MAERWPDRAQSALSLAICEEHERATEDAGELPPCPGAIAPDVAHRMAGWGWGLTYLAPDATPLTVDGVRAAIAKLDTAPPTYGDEYFDRAINHAADLAGVSRAEWLEGAGAALLRYLDRAEEG